MSPSRNSQQPPVMTWGKALPIVVVCVIFDLLRIFFEMFWFFGPALAAVYCTTVANTSLNASVGGAVGTAVAGVCTAAATAAGIAFSAGIQTLGIIMAMAIGLLGWLTVGFLLMLTNGRVFKENASSMLWMLFGLGLSEIPFLGTLPALTATTLRLYHTQIQHDKKNLQQWKQQQASAMQQEQMQQATFVAQMQQQQAIAEAEFEAQQEEEAAQAEQEMQEAAENTSGEVRPEGYRGRQEGSTAQNGPSTGVDAESEEDETQFDTIKDALSELNSKQNRTREENLLLIRAKEIMLKHSIRPDEQHPVLRAAYERALMGQKVNDGTYENRNGFAFNNARIMSEPKKAA